MSSTITVMTANVGAGLAPDTSIEAAVRAELPDIVALQELPRSQASRLHDAVRDVYSEASFFGDRNEGRGIMSRYPILSARTIEIAAGRPDVIAEIDVDGVALTVLVAHPRPQRITRAGLSFDLSSRRQFLRLADMTQDAAPAVMLGDFNMSPRHPGYTRIQERGLVDAFAIKGDGRGVTFPTRVGYTGRRIHEWIVRRKVLPVVRFDYIWCTPDIEVEDSWIGPDAGSDHAPVLARLCLPTSLLSAPPPSP